ncbi:regulator of cell morphogenesis and NO signaling [Dysgonomonas sp. PH5-45]|uniref:hemerythrin domain-containing protein n=1 Tax=unclassified Dysgonomonas TaxID=2630389 RepID=UPI00247465DC|nr:MULTISPECIES: hemerythrin domain-containing protein [unclassified Dysgonomonas]MDH6354902.1 regulator of cell morphogenesis and NO signaling [Dysgonomonas sp. PH5-45]MDH6387801.1 regulator of cell morphogenesis and NO signaling [Dysgonomonas sp. PH5-37]
MIKDITVVFNKSMKMSDLIDADYNLLLLLNKLNIRLGFGEKSVEAVCRENNYDADCFIFLANLQTNKSVTDLQETFNTLPLKPILKYLKGGHSYFLEYKLPHIRRKLQAVFVQEDTNLASLVMKFFDDYTQEVREHMEYEDEVVFPYIESLLNGQKQDYSIGIFESRHNDIEETVKELKQILMKYIPDIKDQSLITNILLDLYMCQSELREHTFLEDFFTIPRIKELEKEI